ncbi:MAG: EthD domain-containing protein [Myxococcota bacterium]
MEKLIYLLGSEMEPNALREALVGPVAERLLATDLLELEVYVSDQRGPDAPPVESQMDPLGLMSASISVWLDSVDGRTPIEEALRGVSTRLAGYSVAESTPREYAKRDWPDGVTSPTVSIGTALGPKPGLSDDEFFACWHGSHTPLSLRIHPLTRYVRNTIARPVTEDAPPYRGIVFESVASLEILTDRDAFYGSEEGQREAVADLLRFVNFKTMGSVTMSETILRAAPWRSPLA